MSLADWIFDLTVNSLSERSAKGVGYINCSENLFQSQYYEKYSSIYSVVPSTGFAAYQKKKTGSQIIHLLHGSVGTHWRSEHTLLIKWHIWGYFTVETFFKYLNIVLKT